MVPQDGHDVPDGELLLGFHEEGVVRVPGILGGVELLGWGEGRVDPPQPPLLVEQAGVGVLAVGLLEAEGRPGLPPALILGEVRQVGAGQEVVRIRGVHLADPGGVGAHGDAVVGHPHRHPVGAGLARTGLPQGAGAHDLEEPGLLGVRQGEGLAVVPVAVLLRQGAHDLDGLPGGLGPLEGEDLKLLDGEPAGLVDALLPAVYGGFPDHELVLVHEGVPRVEVGVGLGHLGDLPHLLQGSGGLGLVAEVLVHRGGGAGGEGLAGDHHHALVIPAVHGVAGHDGPVDGGLFAHQDGGAGQGGGLDRQQEPQGQGEGQSLRGAS